jgi:deoxycytidylate deaminase
MQFAGAATNMHRNECNEEPGNCGSLHAEMAICLNLDASYSYILFSEYLPCINCANAIIEVGCILGVRYVHSKDRYFVGKQLLESYGISCIQQTEFNSMEV